MPARSLLMRGHGLLMTSHGLLMTGRSYLVLGRCALMPGPRLCPLGCDSTRLAALLSFKYDG